MTSCISLLDSYYRLMEKWTFCLSKDLQLPSQLLLKQRRCHGPVGYGQRVPDTSFPELWEELGCDPVLFGNFC